MTLHPWPLNDPGALHETQQVLWTGSWTGQSARGLLTDSLAVPLRFTPELPLAAAIAVVTAEPEPQCNSAAFLRIRGMDARFGTGC